MDFDITLGYIDKILAHPLLCSNSSIDCTNFSTCEFSLGISIIYLYENQRNPVSPGPENSTHCRVRAIYFYNVNAEAIVHIANKQVHMTMFPPFQNGIDERSSLHDAIKNTFGIPETNTFHSDINQKALVIFSYFNVICETILSSPEKVTIQ